MLSPFWFLNGPRASDNAQWVPQGVRLPFQPRPLTAVPLHQMPAYPMAMMCPRPRMRHQIRPLPPTTVYPRQALMETIRIKQEEYEEQSDLRNLEGVLNFNLANILPPDFGFGEVEDMKLMQEMGGLSNQGEVAMQTASGRDMTIVSQSTLKNALSAPKIKSEVREDGVAFPKLVIDAQIPAQKRPAHSYSELIALALNSEGEMTVRELYQWIMDHFDYYQRTEPSKWQPSVRHTLTINSAFTKIKKVRGGNLWGHASQQEQAFTRKQKNHWKKQKIAEYVKTSRRRRKKEGHSSGSSTNTTPELTAEHLKAANRHDSSLLEDEENMDGVEVEAGPPENILIVRTGRGSKSSSNRSTPAKRAKKSTAQVEEPIPEIIKTQTRHGRLTNKLDYKMFSRRGMQQIGSSPNEKTTKPKAECPSSTNNDGFDEEPDCTSDEMDSDQDIFGTSEQHTSSNDIIQEDNDCTQHKTPIDMITPEVSPASSTHSQMFQAIANAALRDLDAACAKTYGQKNNQGTPAQLVVSDLQDFEPTQSTESILASTSALTSFASMSEAAMILSSLETSPRSHACADGGGRVTTYSIEITVEERECPESPPTLDKPSYDSVPSDPCPEVAEEVTVTDQTYDVSAEKMESTEGSKTSGKTGEESVNAFALGDENVGPPRETSTPNSVENVASIVSSPSLNALRVQHNVAQPKTPNRQSQIASPVGVQTANDSPSSSPVRLPTSAPFKPLESPPLAASPDSTESFTPKIPKIPLNEHTSASPMILIEPAVSSQPRPMHQLNSPMQSHFIPCSPPTSPYSSPTPFGAPLSLPPLRSISPNILHCVQPSSVHSSKMQSPGFVNLPYAMGHPPPVGFTAAPWAMSGMHGEPVAQHPLLHQDVHLSDTWTKKQSSTKCLVPDRSKIGVLPPRKQHQPFGQLRNEIVTPIGIPMYMSRGSRMPSPVFQYGRGLRPVCTTGGRSPYMQPAFFVPSPIRPDQTMQAVVPTEMTTPQRPVLQRLNTTRLPPVRAPVATCIQIPTLRQPLEAEQNKKIEPNAKLCMDTEPSADQVTCAK